MSSFLMFSMLSLLMSMHRTITDYGTARFLNSHLLYSGLYYNPITIVNDDSRVVNKLETNLLTPLESSFTIVTCL
jgi:hypothetical protein